MPILSVPTVPDGALRGQTQPDLPTHDGRVLTTWRDDDIAAVRRAYTTPDIQQWHARRIDDDEEAHDWIARWADDWHHERAASWAIRDTAEGVVLGQVGLRGIDLHEGIAAISYWVLPSARGEGVASDALRTMAAWAFDDVGLHRLDLRHSIVNVASCRVAAAGGFTPEGTLRHAALHGDGWHDMHVHGLVAGADSTRAHLSELGHT